MLGWDKTKIYSPCSGDRHVLFLIIKLLVKIVRNFFFLLSNKLLSILNLLCNNTQNVTIQQRDACYGCFFRAGSLPASNVQLVSLSQCAVIYLNGTGYQQCALQLQVSDAPLI